MRANYCTGPRWRPSISTWFSHPPRRVSIGDVHFAINTWQRRIACATLDSQRRPASLPPKTGDASEFQSAYGKRFLPLLALYSLAPPRFSANGSRWSVYRGFQGERGLVGKHSNLTGRHRADGELSSASFETLA